MCVGAWGGAVQTLAKASRGPHRGDLRRGQHSGHRVHGRRAVRGARGVWQRGLGVTQAARNALGLALKN